MYKEMYDKVVIPIIHVIMYLYKDFKENKETKIKWLDIKSFILALNNIFENCVIFDDATMTIKSVAGSSTVIPES